MAYTDSLGIQFSYDETTLLHCSEDYKGEYIIPEGIKKISNDAFSGCTGLTAVTIPDSVTIIGQAAFYGCTKLKTINIPNSVKEIGYAAFEKCTALTAILIPGSVMKIGVGVFSGCTSLTSIKVNGWNEVFDSRNNCNAIIETGSNVLVAVCKSTTIPPSVKGIGYSAFADCKEITEIAIPDGIQSIGGNAFHGCTGLTSISIPDSVTEIDGSAFSGCPNLKSISVSEGNTTYDSRNNCNAIIETAPNILIAGCNSSIIPEGTTEIGRSAFEGCSNITTITIPETVRKIRDYAFRGCTGLTTISLPKGVVLAGHGVFAGCTGLTEASLPESIRTMGEGVFEDCTSLSTLSVGWTIDEDIPADKTLLPLESLAGKAYSLLRIPRGTVGLYKYKEPWNAFVDVEQYDPE